MVHLEQWSTKKKQQQEKVDKKEETVTTQQNFTHLASKNLKTQTQNMEGIRKCHAYITN